MASIGADCGTFNLVSCKRNKDNNLSYKKEVNAFIDLPLENRFVFNMMKQAGVPLIERENVAYALGEAAVNMAYTLPTLELKRPMKDGCVNPKEKDAFQIMSIMLHSIIDPIEKDGTKLYYSVPANAINQETDADYHSKVLEAIFKSYVSEEGYKVDPKPINEALALVYAELGKKAFTGIGISCLCPGTKIYTDEGIVPIETVKEGDKVITHKGRFMPINNVITKNFKGIMTKIQLQGYSNNTENYKFVDNHELYVKRNGNWQWIGCEDLVVGDIVGEPILEKDSTQSKITINICDKITNSKEYVKKHYDSTPSLQRLFGYFLGDGSVNLQEGCLQFDFANNEKTNINDVKDIISDVFGKNCSDTPHGENCTRVKCYSKGLSNYFNNHFYDECGFKKYPWQISRLSKNEALNLLIGMCRSDGSFSEDSISFFNTNTRLILLAKQLFSRIGLAASISYRNPRSHSLDDGRIIQGIKDEWKVNSTGKKISQSVYEMFANINVENCKIIEKTFIENGFCCSYVQKIEHEEYEGIVYDLQVAEDHSFSGPYLTIHNCGAGMVNVCYAMYGNPIFQFAIVNSGDWIDKQAAKATGESPTFINKEKTKIDLGKAPTDLVERAIITQYRLMIEKTVQGIKEGLATSNKSVKSEHPVDFIVAGGTAAATGFTEIFSETLKQANLTIPIGDVIRPAEPLFSVAKGTLIAAEASDSN